MNEMKTKSFRLTEVKADMETGVFEGYASVFGNKDAYGDIVVPGAFSKTLQERADRVKILWQHDTDCPIGKPTEMREDVKGLYVKGKITPTSLGKDVIMLLQDGVICEMSIGYQTVKEEWDDSTKCNYLKEIKLYEFSLVTFPANELATVTSVKNNSNIDVCNKLNEILEALQKQNEPTKSLEDEEKDEPSDDDTQEDEDEDEETDNETDDESVKQDEKLKQILHELKKFEGGIQ